MTASFSSSGAKAGTAKTRRSEYSIAAVSKLTGVSCHALRVWERRYGFPTPMRSASGHRRFTPDQVEAIQRVVNRVRSGSPIGDAIEAFRGGRMDRLAVAAMPTANPEVQTLVNLMQEGDIGAAHTLFDQVARRLSPVQLVGSYIEPAMVLVGERWYRGEIEIYQERAVTCFLAQKLGRLIDVARQANVNPERRAVIGTVQGDRHGGGVELVSLIFELSGWRAIQVGVDVPVLEYQKAIDRWHPDLIAISFVLSRNVHKRFSEISHLTGSPVLIGGRSILNYQGLARKHGLITLTGSASSSLPAFLHSYESWKDQRPIPCELDLDEESESSSD